MKIKLTSIFVNDQERALSFYTEVLGFVKKRDLPAGDYKWITVVSPEGPEDIELLLEPLGHPAAETFQKEMFKAGIPLMTFAVDDIHKEYERLLRLGVVFKMKPVDLEETSIAVFHDTCGNLIQLFQG
ncbi:VOC family protein [Brevibacillus laterosporus]|uniref:VOC family protein n=1 Tax=Brevibacillus laterosporus TaxID=1465 RepID=UPI00264EB726|nr:VOC family protein [Brevibacillus laterosporus]MDN9011677.1 VOC family protein [Brevibacillus laterosporus]MDO0942677.1 VOC family protein [Brevibacillus laterosporus]